MAEQENCSKRQKMVEQEKIPFGTDVSQLLEKMNGISHGAKEVFLWELVRIANYGLYRMRRMAMYNEDEIDDPRGLFIDIIPDKSNHTLSIVDNGIGLPEDFLSYLFTIPEDSLEQFMDMIDKLKENNINVDEFYLRDWDACRLGFFASYMVADKVQITTKHYEDDKQRSLFSSRDSRFFFVESCTNISGLPGTKITLELDEDQFEYLDESRLKVLIDKFTFHLCPYPISIRVDNKVNIIQRLADVEENNKDKRLMMKKKFTGFRKLSREVLGRLVENVIVSDHIYDLPSYLSDDGKKLVINPKSPQMEKLREDAERNPKDKVVEAEIRSLFVYGRARLHLYRQRRGDYRRVEMPLE